MNPSDITQHPVQRMIDHIEYSLTELDDFSLPKLGEFMGYSPFYCSFLFRHHTGISIKKYIHLRKLILAAAQLKETDERIIDIAMNYGYASQEAFSRAFKDLFGTTPAAYRQQPTPLQMYAKRNLYEAQGAIHMDVTTTSTITNTILRLQDQVEQLHEQDILNVLNGQIMYEKFHSNQWMGASEYVPFNEAMCVHPVTEEVFSRAFNRVRAEGHGGSLHQYEQIVIQPLQKLFTQLHDYKCIVLWFGDDMFCQLNLLTLLAYLEQQQYRGQIYFNTVHEQTYDVQQTEMELGIFSSLYTHVLLEHQLPEQSVLPVMYQGIRMYIQLQQPDHELYRYITAHPERTEAELVRDMLNLFTHYGLGDTQYIEMIHHVRKD